MKINVFLLVLLLVANNGEGIDRSVSKIQLSEKAFPLSAVFHHRRRNKFNRADNSVRWQRRCNGEDGIPCFLIRLNETSSQLATPLYTSTEYFESPTSTYIVSPSAEPTTVTTESAPSSTNLPTETNEVFTFSIKPGKEVLDCNPILVAEIANGRKTTRLYDNQYESYDTNKKIVEKRSLKDYLFNLFGVRKNKDNSEIPEGMISTRIPMALDVLEVNDVDVRPDDKSMQFNAEKIKGDGREDLRQVLNSLLEKVEAQEVPHQEYEEERMDPQKVPCKQEQVERIEDLEVPYQQETEGIRQRAMLSENDQEELSDKIYEGYIANGKDEKKEEDINYEESVLNKNGEYADQKMKLNYKENLNKQILQHFNPAAIAKRSQGITKNDLKETNSRKVHSENDLTMDKKTKRLSLRNTKKRAVTDNNGPRFMRNNHRKIKRLDRKVDGDKISVSQGTGFGILKEDKQLSYGSGRDGSNTFNSNLPLKTIGNFEPDLHDHHHHHHEVEAEGKEELNKVKEALLRDKDIVENLKENNKNDNSTSQDIVTDQMESNLSDLIVLIKNDTAQDEENVIFDANLTVGKGLRSFLRWLFAPGQKNLKVTGEESGKMEQNKGVWSVDDQVLPVNDDLKLVPGNP